MAQLDVKNLLAKMLQCPRVIESGVDDIWNYRKWSDGTAECWGTATVTISNYGVAFGGGAYQTHVTFPTGLFKTAPVVTFSANAGGDFSLTGTLAGSTTKDSTNLYLVTSTTGTKNCAFYIHAIGNWK